MADADIHARLAALEAALASRDEEVRSLRATVDHLRLLAAAGETAGEVMHDLNQPIQVLSAYLEMFQSDSLPEASRGLGLERMERAVKRMKALATHFRAYLRGPTAETFRLDLRGLVLGSVGAVDGAGTVAVSVSGPDGVFVAVESNLVRQVVVTLLSREWTMRGHPATVRVEADGAVARLVFVAGGPPWPTEESLSLAANAEYYAGCFHARMAAVQVIVAQHGGRITVAPIPDDGTHTVLELPRVP